MRNSRLILTPSHISSNVVSLYDIMEFNKNIELDKIKNFKNFYKTYNITNTTKKYNDHQ
jgi:hypothetical protein